MTALDEAIALAAGGGAPDTVALMRILMESASEPEGHDALQAAITAADGAARNNLERVAALWQVTPGAWSAVRGTIQRVAHEQPGASADEALAYWSDSFDRLVAAAPEASVALYSLGSPRLLAEATGEIVTRLADWGLLPSEAAVLDLGCGIGRFVEALAPRVARITGLDLSAGMIEEARRRCARFANVTLRQSSGRDLAGIPDASFDLVLAADVFPYLVASGGGLAAAHVAEAGRVLRPGGALLILNHSYRGDNAADRADVAACAAAFGFAIERSGTRDFALWDGETFLLRRAAAAASFAGTVPTVPR